MPLELLCHVCDGQGCSECENGFHVVKQCPTAEIGQKVLNLINLIIFANKGHLPKPGTILEQPAKFIHSWQAFNRDKEFIDEERRRRSQNGRRH